MFCSLPHALVFALVILIVLVAGCSNNRPIEDRSITHENQLLLPDRVRELTVFTGPEVAKVNGSLETDFADGLDFRWGMREDVTYRFPLIFSIGVEDLFDNLLVIPSVGLSGLGFVLFDASKLMFQPHLGLTLASTRFENATPHVSLELIPTIHPFDPFPGYNGIEKLEVGSLHSWNRLSVNWAGTIWLTHNMFYKDWRLDDHLRSGRSFTLGYPKTHPSIAYRIWRGLHAGAWLKATYFFDKPRREDLGIVRQGVSASAQLGVVWRF